MAPENQDDPDQTPPVLNTETPIQPASKPPRLKKFKGLFTRLKPRKTKKYLLFILILIVVLVGCIYYATKQLGGDNDLNPAVTQKDYAIKVNGKTYTQADLYYWMQPIKELNNVSDQEAIDMIYKALVNVEVAKTLGIEPTEEAITKEVSSAPNFDKQNGLIQSWLRLLAKSNIIDRTVADYKANGTNTQGYSYIFRFGENLESGPSYKAPGFGNQELIERDKQYAKAKADEYHKKLTEKTITPEQALKEIKADGRLGYFYKSGTNKSARFNVVANVLSRDVFYDTVAEAVKSQKPGGMTQPQAGKTVADAEKDEEIETYYYFVLVESTGQSGAEFTQSLNEVTNKINEASDKGTP